MSKLGRRTHRNPYGKDLQGIAVWLIIVGVAFVLLFPSFFKGVYTRLSEQSAVTAESTNTALTTQDSSSNTTTGNLDNYASDLTDVTKTLSPDQTSEVSSGYWAIFVRSGEFTELPLSNDTYTFVEKLIENDRKGVMKNTLILAANGQIQKFVVSDELYGIVTNIAVIEDRAKKGS